MTTSSSPPRKRLSILAVIGPGLLVAATGVGAGDLAGGAFAGSKLGVVVLWAVLLGALMKFVTTEGLARWQLATGETLLEGAVTRLGRPVQYVFLAYLLVWTIGVGSSLISACGVAAHALFPVFGSAVQGKIGFGIGHSLIGLGLVWLGSYATFERLMGVFVGLMFVTVVSTALLIRPDWGAVAQGLVWPSIPAYLENGSEQGVAWTLALMGGVGGTLTVLSYGYWIREEGRQGADDVRVCRLDLGVAYLMTALFGLAVVIIASASDLEQQASATLVVTLAEQLREPLGETGRMVFLIGTWAAMFTSLLGVWQSVPYLFADFWGLVRRPRAAEPVEAIPVDTRGRPYRGYLLFITFVPMLGLQYDFAFVQKANAVFGALVMPMLALALLLLNGRADWVGPAFKNRPMTVAALIGILLFFAYTGLPQLYRTLFVG